MISVSQMQRSAQSSQTEELRDMEERLAERETVSADSHRSNNQIMSRVSEPLIDFLFHRSWQTLCKRLKMQTRDW